MPHPRVRQESLALSNAPPCSHSASET